MVQQLWLLFMLSAAVSVVSVTTSKAGIFKPLRKRVKKASEWFGELVGCPFCTSMWLSFAITGWYQPVFVASSVKVVDLLVSSFAIVFVASLCSGLIFRAFAGVETSSDEDEDDE